jgi:choline dehydrogenase-like flavoprotein
MESFDFVIVGSGPAGIAAARRLQGQSLCMIDVGIRTQERFPYSSLRDALAAGDPKSILGSKWEMLGNLVEPQKIHAKLRHAAIRYVANGTPFTVTDKPGNICLYAAGSHAAGGMSNAWGAQLLRYNDLDIGEAGDWPINATALAPYYLDLEAHIGISGEMDDMREFLGETETLLPPTPISPAAAYLLSKYNARKKQSLISLGRSRLAVITESFRGYAPCDFGEIDFFSTEQDGIYTAYRSLNELRRAGRMEYRAGHEVIAYKETPDFVEITARSIATNETTIIRAKHLLLGCGAIQTARLVLLNNNAIGRKLPFIDHPPTLVPLFIPSMFGSSMPDRSYPVQLIATLKQATHRDMISIYYPGALLFSDLLPDIPLPMNTALKLLPNLLGGMLVAQIWEKSRPHKDNCLQLDQSGAIRIDYPRREPYPRLALLLRELRRFGVYSHRRLASMSPPGWGFHYAGCLPMRDHPNRFETHIDGRLWNRMRVRAIDGSVLPSLPAKNHSLTLMANAARIANEALNCGY